MKAEEEKLVNGGSGDKDEKQDENQDGDEAKVEPG